MLVIPAIDLKNGKCVRLREGKMDQETIFSSSPIDVAGSWFKKGAELLHIVDLDGAINGNPVNKNLIKEIVSQHSDLSVQIGGGIRSFDTAREYLNAGADRIVIGTYAVKKPDFIHELCDNFPNQVILGIDAKDGLVRTDGWLGISSITPYELAKQYEGLPIYAIIFTDISRDGMMKGININATIELASSTSIPIIASGGISNLNEIQALASVDSTKLHGVICGRSLYEKTFTLEDAIQVANNLE